MRSLESMVEELSDLELENCFLEIVEWRKTGVLQMHSIVRKLWEEYKNESGNKAFPIHYMSEPIFFEICNRKYREDGINV